MKWAQVKDAIVDNESAATEGAASVKAWVASFHTILPSGGVILPSVQSPPTAQMR